MRKEKMEEGERGQAEWEEKRAVRMDRGRWEIKRSGRERREEGGKESREMKSFHC